MNLTQTHYETLQPLEHYLYTAYYHQYVRTLTMKDANTLNNIHQELFGRKQDLTCGKCVLNLCKSLGKLYFDYKN